MVESRKSLALEPTLLVSALLKNSALTITMIFDVESVGVIVAVIVVSVNVVVAIEVCVVETAETTCKTFPPPAAGAAHVGTPPATVRTLPVLPIARRVFVFAVAER